MKRPLNNPASYTATETAGNKVIKARVLVNKEANKPAAGRSTRTKIEKPTEAQKPNEKHGSEEVSIVFLGMRINSRNPGKWTIAILVIALLFLLAFTFMVRKTAPPADMKRGAQIEILKQLKK